MLTPPVARWLLLLCGAVSAVGSTCPQYCTCDVWKQIFRATCKNKQLVSIEANIPHNVEYLDLSFNLIRSIDDKSFMNLHMIELKQVNLSHNHIQHMGLRAFAGCIQLQTLDISHNHLKYLLQATFWDTPYLQRLIVAGNELSERSGVLLDIPHLKVLDLSKCRIDHLTSETFSKMQNLVTLNLSANYLTYLDATVLAPLKKLRSLDLSQNPLICGSRLDALQSWLSRKQVAYSTRSRSTSCQSTGVKRMGEKKLESMIAVANMGDMDSGKTIDDVWPITDNKINDSSSSSEQKKCAYKSWIYNSTFFNISPVWLFIIGLQVGAMTGMFGTWIMWQCANRSPRQRTPNTSRLLHVRRPMRRSLRMHSNDGGSPWMELQTIIDCPETPPPPYKDVSVPQNSVL